MKRSTQKSNIDDLDRLAQRINQFTEEVEEIIHRIKKDSSDANKKGE